MRRTTRPHPAAVRTLPHAVTALALGFLLTGTAAAQDTVRWLDMDFPPFFISEGPAAGQGMGDRIADLLSTELTGYRHERDRASPDRIMGLISAGDPVCSVAFLRTPERERTMAFSVADMVLPPNGLIVRRGDETRFSTLGSVSLAGLVDSGNVRLGTAAGRSYGAALDPILADAPDGSVFERQGDDILRGLLQMLVRERLDAVLGYPYESRWIADQLGISDQIAFLPLEEASDFTTAHVVCPRTEWGHALIERIDGILLERRTTPGYRAFVERWMPEDRIEDLRTAWDRTLASAVP